MKRIYYLFIFFFFAVSFSTSAFAQNHILWASTGSENNNGGGRIYTIDPDSQLVTLVGNTGLERTGALACDNNGNLYTFANGSSGPAEMYSVDKLTGSANFIGETPESAIDGIAFDSSNTLYASNCCSDLYTLNTSNATIISSVGLSGTGNSFVAGLAFDPSGQLYGSRGNASGHLEDLVRINTNTGVMTSIGVATNVISDIWFADDGTLYGGSPNGDLFMINPDTGAKTFLFNTGLRISGLTGGCGVAVNNVPTLSQWGLLAMAGILVIVALVAIRRRKLTV